MLQSYEPKRNTVITKSLLLSLANEQQSKKRRRRLITDLDKIEEIRLEYLNILKIDCLWPLSNLVKLKLNNNVIEKIENLESLVNLCELDLSFNRIKKIENLEALENIHILSLYDNDIDTVEGIDHMKHLTILSIGKNNIIDIEHVLYFRNLKELRSLQMAGNPCTERSGYVNYLIAFVPQLVYYGYRMITEDERADAKEKHRVALSNMVEVEEKKAKEQQVVEDTEAKVAQQSISYVEYLDEDSLFQQMYANDEEGKKLVELDAELTAAYEQYRQNFSDVCNQLYELGLKEELRRREEIRALNDVVDERLDIAMNRARQIMDSVEGKKKEITVRVTQMLREAALDDADLDDDAIDEIDKIAMQLSYQFSEYVSSVWEKLMREETIIHEQIQEMSEMFEININDMVGAFLEAAQDYFGQLRALETEFSENLMPLVLNLLNNVEDEEKTPFLTSLTEDKDALNNCLTSSHFAHLQVIDDRQDRMTKRLTDWKNKFLKNLVEDENERSRNRILEINHYLDNQRENTTVSKLMGQQLQQVDADDDDEQEGEEDNSNEGTEYTGEN